MLKEKILKEANELASEIVSNRRVLHKYAEVGFDIPHTLKYIKEKLLEYGYEPKACGKAGLVATVGNPGKTILLRADTDALPITEKTGLDFAAENGNSHACGHDCHAAMLLGAAKLLKEHESELCGTVKLMFQPAEELLQGAKDMVDNGVLRDPNVDVGFGIHVMTGLNHSTTGTLICPLGTISRSGDAFKVTIHGRDTHGSKPYMGVDALSISSYINLALQTIIAREIPSDENSVLLVGTGEGGTTCNTVAGTAVMEISVRTEGNKQREFLFNRIEEVVTKIAEAFRATATIEHVYGSPPLANDKDLTDKMISYGTELLGEENLSIDPPGGPSGGEDFSFIAENVPVTFFYLGVGSLSEGYCSQHHTPDVKFNEEALPLGAAIHTYFAMRWLKDNR